MWLLNLLYVTISKAISQKVANWIIEWYCWEQHQKAFQTTSSHAVIYKIQRLTTTPQRIRHHAKIYHTDVMVPWIKIDVFRMERNQITYQINEVGSFRWIIITVQLSFTGHPQSIWCTIYNMYENSEKVWQEKHNQN